MANLTIHDVAARAGVSISTVSRAMRGIGYVNAKKREQVLQAAAELGYVPHASAQALRAQRSGVIGVVAGDLGNPHTVALINSIQKFVGDRGYTALFTSVINDGEARELAHARKGSALRRARRACLFRHVSTLRESRGAVSRQVALHAAPLASSGRSRPHRKAGNEAGC